MWTSIKSNPILPLILCFIFINLASREDGATNERSRYATLRAMAQERTFRIDNYKDWTEDWAYKEPHYFSNKAPGPMLLGFPLFFFLDFFSKYDRKQIFNADGLKINRVTSTPRVIMALFYQIIPFSLLCLCICRWLLKNNFDSSAIIFFSLAALFGNTSSLFMNIFFGHSMAALFLLAMSYFILKKKFFWVGLSFGLALLTEYSTALLLFPLLIILIFSEKKNLTWIKPFILGGALPGILWIWYHTATLGSPFSIPPHFQNPKWVGQSTAEMPRLWGLFAIPNKNILFELLVGQERGLLFTQPWLLFMIPVSSILLFKKTCNEYFKLSIFCLMGLFFLLVMNASFNGWHGGSTSGPRYLSNIFPCFALLGAFTFKEIKNKFIKSLLFIGLFISLIFRSLVYGSISTAPEGNKLWPWLWQDLLDKDGSKGEIKVIVFIISLIIALYFTFKNFKSLKIKNGEKNLERTP